MSTKATLLLTTDNEHWYRELNGRYYENTKTEYCIVLEIDPRHRVETDEEGTRIIIEDNTPLYELLNKTSFHDNDIPGVITIRVPGDKGIAAQIDDALKSGRPVLVKKD